MSLLIDADYIVYKACAASEDEIDFGDDVIVVTSKFSEAYDMVMRELYSIAECLGTFDDSLLFFSDSKNFRKKIYPDYKGHRNRKKPCGYKRVINKLRDDFPVIRWENMEADDALGIYATQYPGNIIVSPDKDMRQIPGDLFDLTNPVQTITKEEGDRWHYVQTMAGDATDGYSGVPSIGVKRANALLDAEGCTWETVVKAFKSKDLGEDIALQNARLAKILQYENYPNGNIELWTPPDASDSTNTGAGSEAKTAAGSAA